MEENMRSLKLEIRRWLIFFMAALILSGITAFDVVSGLETLHEQFKGSRVDHWVGKVLPAVQEVQQRFPELFYGYDWLAFGHIVIATAFIGPLIDPVKNEWVIVFGMIACLMVLPAAFIMGAVRNIPVWWRVVDCSFGIFGFIPLYIVWKKIKRLSRIQKATSYPDMHRAVYATP